MWTRSLATADLACGGKAFGLARLIAAGLPVPDGFVVDHRAFDLIAAIGMIERDAIGHTLAAAAARIERATLPAELEAEVRARAGPLGRLAVRSSASLEDGELGAGAGVFASVTDVAPGDVWAAVRAVWTSALTPLAVAYARRRAAAPALAVIVQQFAPGERVTVYTRPIGAPAGDAVWIARGEQLERVPRATAGAHAEAALALAAEHAIGAPGGADVELIVEVATDALPGGGPARASATRRWVVQARPILHPVHRRAPPPPPIVVAPLVHDGRRWTWDVAHNPDPLSPAQAGLVAEVDRVAAAPYALRVCGGYLYTCPRGPLPAPACPADRAELASRIAAIEARFELGDAASVAEAIARYVAFMRIWAYELSPLVAVARRRLLDRLAADGHPADQLARRAAELIGPRQVLRDPVLAPAWDVAVPAFDEVPAAVRQVQVPALAPEPPSELAGEVGLARAAAAAADQDDVWFARAQRLMRRALRTRGAALGLRDDDVFWLPLAEIARAEAIDPDAAHRRAAAARAAHDRAAQWQMPIVIHGAIVDDFAPAPGAILRGVGVGPRVVGRVVRFAPLAGRALPWIARGDVVVARAITPALAMIVEGCGALVSETGGLLDHGAALARELGIPCVVGCHGAWTQLDAGTLVFVDGDAGLIGPLTTPGEHAPRPATTAT
jgi:phosphohistidine swiveling domain-containing protein